jgi:hypothetical protein
MNALDPSALALGFFAVIGLGLLAMYAGIHLRRVHTAQRITANAAYLDAQLADVPPQIVLGFDGSRTGEVHVCNVNGNCARGRAAQ